MELDTAVVNTHLRLLVFLAIMFAFAKVFIYLTAILPRHMELHRKYEAHARRVNHTVAASMAMQATTPDDAQQALALSGASEYLVHYYTRAMADRMRVEHAAAILNGQLNHKRFHWVGYNGTLILRCPNWEITFNFTPA